MKRLHGGCRTHPPLLDRTFETSICFEVKAIYGTRHDTLDHPTLVTIDEADVAASRAALRLQVERGGLRLARLLDEAVG